MDFTKFIYLLEYKKLHFSSLSTLASVDPFEGSLGKRDLDFDHTSYEEYKKTVGANPLDEHLFEVIKNSRPKARMFLKNLRFISHVNCWHMNEYESAAMWSSYQKTQDGIAITSTYEKLCKSVSEEKEPIYIGQVEYVDYEDISLSGGNIFIPAVFKRKSFEHERELRAYICDLTNDAKHIFDKDLEKSNTQLPTGRDVPVNLFNLIEEIIISPASEEWFKKLVESVATKYGFQGNIKKSSIKSDPYF